MTAKPEDRRSHWDGVYASKAPTEVSWFQERPTVSLELIHAAGLAAADWIVDVGGGASTLVDHLWGSGYRHLTVLDVSARALEHAKARFGHEAQEVEWVAGDVTLWEPPRRYALWHDRAVFHFLTEAADRSAYVGTLQQALAPGGHVIVATFALDGPEKCSGLPVRRYSPEMLEAELGGSFSLQDVREEEHRTPGDKPQQFVYCRFRRDA